MSDSKKNKYIYSAFISYRHADPDQIIAKRIQHSIETFSIPAEYQSSGAQKHFKKVFRDSDELSMDKDLTTGIDYALEQSEYLIVILSPQYKESQWCLHEIEEFLKTHDRANILCVLAEGEPQNVLPQIITHVPSNEDPSSTVIKEPLCADYRLDANTSERFEFPRLVSSVLHCSYDDLVKRQEIYRRKKYIKIGITTVAVAALIIILQMHNLLKLNAAYQDTLYSQSQTLAMQALQHLSDFDRKEALELSIRSLTNGGGKASTATAEALHATAKSTYAYRPSTLAQIRSRSMQNDIINYEITPNLKRVITMDTSAWILVHSNSGEQIAYWQIDGTDNNYFGFIMQDEYNVLAWRGGNIYSYDYEGYRRNWSASITDDSDGSGILSAEIVGNSACSVMTENGITLIDLTDGHILDRLAASEIEKNVQTEYPSGEDAIPSATGFLFQRQYVNENGAIILSGKLETENTSGRLSPEFCIASWNPAAGELVTRVYDQPAFCVQMRSPKPGQLIVISARNRFHVPTANRLSTKAGSNEFSPMKILGFDIDTLELMWEYDTDVMQTVNVPTILYMPPEDDTMAPLAAVIFDVDTYIFDLNSGELSSAMTLPDDIVLADTLTREQAIYYCSNHYGYYILPEQHTISETDGLSPFPEKVQAAERIDDQIIAFSGRYIYWFGTVKDTNYIGQFKLNAMQQDLEFDDAGDGLLAAHTHDKFYIIDLRQHKIMCEMALDEGDYTDEDIEWRFIGSLPDESGVLMLSKYEKTGKTSLYSYNSGTNDLTKIFDFSEKTDYDPGSDWITSFAYTGGIVYMVSPVQDHTLIYYDAVNGVSGELSVQGLPSTAILADSYNDYVHESKQAQPAISLSPDGCYLFSSMYDSSDGNVGGVVISLKSGECKILDSLQYNDTRSRITAFSDDNSAFACSTNYTILIYTESFSEHKTINTSGLNVRSMYWYKNELWVEFSNNTVKRYSKTGEQLSDIELDYEISTSFREEPQWSVIPISDSNEAIMLVDSGNMNLLSTDQRSTTPILHIPDFIGWDNNNDTFMVMDVDTDEVNQETGLLNLSIYNYKHYTDNELVQIGQKQLEELQSETEPSTQ